MHPCRGREIPTTKKTSTEKRTSLDAGRSRPFGATMCKWSNEPLGGRVCGRAKLLAGTLRCLRLFGFSLGIGRTRNSWGVAPNPTRELRPLTPQGTLSLDPFSASRLECASFTRLLREFFRLPPLVYVPKPSTASPTAQSRRPSRQATNTTRRESRKSATA